MKIGVDLAKRLGNSLTMKVTKQEFEVLKQAAKNNLADSAKAYGVSLTRYCEQNLQDSVEKATEWEMARIAYGKELCVGAGVSCE